MNFTKEEAACLIHAFSLDDEDMDDIKETASHVFISAFKKLFEAAELPLPE